MEFRTLRVELGAVRIEDLRQPLSAPSAPLRQDLLFTWRRTPALLCDDTEGTQCGKIRLDPSLGA